MGPPKDQQLVGWSVEITVSRWRARYARIAKVRGGNGIKAAPYPLLRKT